MPTVSYDRRAIQIDGKRTLILSGAVHYPRSTPGMWPELFKRSRDAGLNTIETYVFWNLHERRRDVFDFSDRLDLRRFVATAAEHGLYVILRIGPYICSETNFGGFPAWLRDVPDVRFRTYNEPFMREMERWVRTLCDHMTGLFAPEGGPIILAQIENEYEMIGKRYGRDGKRYAQWAIDMSLSLGLGIPWVMCVGSAPGAIETINGFIAYDEIDRHFAKHPDQPALWTEHWPAWYDVWGEPHHTKPATEVAYATARFFAAGGTGVNYYMWHGGTNFGRSTMFLQTTSYDFDAPLDEFGLPTTKSNQLGRLHQVLADHAELLLESERAKPQPLGKSQCAYSYGRGDRSLVFLCNDAPDSAAEVKWDGRTHRLSPGSVTILADGRSVMNTAEVPAASLVERRMRAAGVKLSRFETWAEPLPHERPAHAPGTVTLTKPVEQLQLTKDLTDYCWYATTVTVPKGRAGKGELELRGVADVVHVFVDGKLVGTTTTLLEENRGKPDGEGYTQTFAIELTPGRHELSVLCCSLGLIKGDWQLGDVNMAEERKGFWGTARWRGKKVTGSWTITPGLVGEGARLFADGAAAVTWRPAAGTPEGKPLRWYRTTFDRPKTARPLAIDLCSMTKGLAWLNGRCLGRYWLVEGTRDFRGWLAPYIRAARQGEPTQRYYHLPADWLEDRNTLVLFEELGGSPGTIKVCEWRRTPPKR